MYVMLCHVCHVQNNSTSPLRRCRQRPCLKLRGVRSGLSAPSEFCICVLLRCRCPSSTPRFFSTPGSPSHCTSLTVSAYLFQKKRNYMERYLTDSEYYLNLTKGLGRRSFAELCYTCTILHWASWFCFSRARLCAARYFMIPNQDWFGSTPGSCPLFITQTGVPQLPPSSSKSLHCSIMLHHSPPPEVTFELWGLIEDTTWKQTSEQHSLSTFATSEDRVKNWGRGCGTRSCSSVQLSRSPGKLTELTGSKELQRDIVRSQILQASFSETICVNIK